ncbi:MAG: glycosyltransferase [Scytolyngbya sp. HA4215-MV1]|nr:glycosyltransferase [Scytolyngbya sp. HA4215-MV1]
MQRLLFITERFPPDIGGLASSAGRLTQTLCQLDVAVDVLTWSRFLRSGEVLPPETEREIETEQPKVYRVGLYRHWDMTLPHTLNLMDWLHQIHPYSGVWGHYLFPSGFLATWFAEMQVIPSLVSVRGNDLDRALFPPGDFARLQWTLERASLITAVSRDIAHKVQTLSQRQAGVILFPNTVDSGMFTPLETNSENTTETIRLRQALGIRAEEVILGFSGELREKKGQQFLLQALATVRSHRPACLLIIGEVRLSEQSVLQNFGVQHPGAASRIIITGHLANPEQVAKHLRLCDVYLQPSLWEGMPNALLEAMACGCCCIASDAGGIPEVITHGKTGFLLPRSQLHRLGEAILEFLALSPVERISVSHAARAWVQSHHSPKQEKHQLQQLIAKLGT